MAGDRGESKTAWFYVSSFVCVPRRCSYVYFELSDTLSLH